MRTSIWAALGAMLLLTAALQTTRASGGDEPFGGKADRAFAAKTWKAMDGYRSWKLTTPVYKGGSPHGKWVRLFSTYVSVAGRSYPIIVKENYGGRGATRERIDKDPDAWLRAITAMLQREPGYDSENQNWFWVKYGPKGEVEKNPAGVALAGRVAKGAKKGCISCHLQARGGDYLFSNDD